MSLDPTWENAAVMKELSRMYHLEKSPEKEKQWKLDAITKRDQIDNMKGVDIRSIRKSIETVSTHFFDIVSHQNFHI
jgi:hypothetical protein